MPKQWRRHRHLRRWTTTKNKEVIRKFFEAFDRHDIERMDEFVSTAGYGFYFPIKPATDWNGHEQLIAAIISISRHP